MSDAPERIWICHLDGFTDPGEPPLWELISEHAALPDDPCYLRADLHTAALAARDARIAALEAGLRQLADGREPMVHDLHRDRCVHRRSPDEECLWCARAFARALLDGGKA
jgi:hypothetical protein